MINLYSTKRVKRKIIDRFSKFVLLGNIIDGFVNVGIIEFENFEDVKTRLPNIIKNIKCAGEWDLKLYQTPEILKIKCLYGYYKVPLKGKLILEFSYMNVDQNIEVSVNNSLIHIYTYSDLSIVEKNQETGVIINGSVMEEFITVLLYDRNDKKNYVFEQKAIENDKYFRLINSSDLKYLSNYSFD